MRSQSNLRTISQGPVEPKAIGYDDTPYDVWL